MKRASPTRQRLAALGLLGAPLLTYPLLSLPAGSLVLSGGATEAVSVQAGDHVRLRVQGMGSVSLRFA